jgi:hypothetical protein
MSWQAPVTDWVDADTIAYTDHNRIEGNNDVLRDMFEIASKSYYRVDSTGDYIAFKVPVALTDGQTLTLLHAFYDIEEYGSTTATFKVQYGSSAAWGSVGSSGSDFPDQVLHTASGSEEEYLKIIVNITSLDSDPEEHRRVYFACKLEIA